MRISDWSSDVCSSDLLGRDFHRRKRKAVVHRLHMLKRKQPRLIKRIKRRPADEHTRKLACAHQRLQHQHKAKHQNQPALYRSRGKTIQPGQRLPQPQSKYGGMRRHAQTLVHRSEEHTSELQSLMRISYAVFCLKKKKKQQTTEHIT